MHVEPMTMDPRIAAIHFKDYRKKVREHRAQRIAAAKSEITEGNKMRRGAYSKLSLIEQEDTVLMESYRAMAKGARIINVASVIREAGLDKVQQLPKLAIARANWKDCYLRIEKNMLWFTSQTYIRTGWKDAGRVLEPTKVVQFMGDLLGAELTNEAWRKQNSFPSLVYPYQKAVVPLIPIQLRPTGDLVDYFILWEAKWEKEVPLDPLLLKHVAGHMYSVVAQWDLTPLEQAVLEGRIS